MARYSLHRDRLNRNRLKRYAGGAMVGTAVAGGLLVPGPVPWLGGGEPASASAKATTPGGGGYWLATSNGTVYNFGDAVSYGSMAGKHLAAPIVGIVAAPDGKGYWLVARDGGVFAFGSARFYSSLPGLTQGSAGDWRVRALSAHGGRRRA